MNQKKTLIAIIFLICLAGCVERNANSSNQSTSAQINATRDRINNLKTNANQRINSIESIAAQNANNSNSY